MITLDTYFERLARENRGNYQNTLAGFMNAFGLRDADAVTIAAHHTLQDIDEATKRHCERFHTECEELAARTGTKYIGRD